MFNGKRYIEIARALRPDHQCRRTFHATFIIKKGKIQKIGINSLKTHTRNLQYDYTGKDEVDIRTFVGIHSELSAIIKFGKEHCTDCTFVNVRINMQGEPAMAAPCRGCQSVLQQVGYKRVYFTNNLGEFEQWR